MISSNGTPVIEINMDSSQHASIFVGPPVGVQTQISEGSLLIAAGNGSNFVVSSRSVNLTGPKYLYVRMSNLSSFNIDSQAVWKDENGFLRIGF